MRAPDDHHVTGCHELEDDHPVDVRWPFTKEGRSTDENDSVVLDNERIIQLVRDLTGLLDPVLQRAVIRTNGLSAQRRKATDPLGTMNEATASLSLSIQASTYRPATSTIAS